MNKIITVKRLVELLSKTAGVDAVVAESFVRSLTSLVRDALARGESVSIAGVGTFQALNDRVVFVPDPALAKAVNAPFAMFEVEELAPNASEELLESAVVPVNDTEFATEEPSVAQTAETSAPSNSAEQTAPVQSAESQCQDTVLPPVKDETQLESKEILQPQPIQEPPASPKAEPQTQSQDELQPKAQDLPANHGSIAEAAPRELRPFISEDDDDAAAATYDHEDSGLPYFWIGWGVVAGLIIGLCIGFFLHDPIIEALEPQTAEEYNIEESAPALEPESEAAELESLTQSEPVPEPATQVQSSPSPATESANADKEVWDVITNKTYLAHLAKKHYGNKDYWVYIYMENASVIGDPNKVKAGTRVKIPPLSKYATASTEAENLEAARRKAEEIQRKY